MKTYLFGAAAMLLAATLLFGCGYGTVSDDPNGRITDPTVVTPTIIPAPTMDPDDMDDPTMFPSMDPTSSGSVPTYGNTVPDSPETQPSEHIPSASEKSFKMR